MFLRSCKDSTIHPGGDKQVSSGVDNVTGVRAALTAESNKSSAENSNKIESSACPDVATDLSLDKTRSTTRTLLVFSKKKKILT